MLLRSILVALTLTTAALAQSADTRALNAYTAAISAPAGERGGKLEAFLAAEPHSSLRNDALAWLTWTELEVQDAPAAASYGRSLLAVDPGSPLARAATLNTSAPAIDKRGLHDMLERAQNALGNLDGLRRPEGMANATFATMKRQVAGLLDGAAGTAAWKLDDFDSARVYLQYALSVFPGDARYMYALGVVDLDGKPRKADEGYWYLARAVNISRSGAIANYAYGRYIRDGGTYEQWRQFLASTAAPGVRYVAPRADAATVVADAKRPGPLTVPPLPPAPKTAAEDAGPLIIPPEERAPRTGEPVSLGILLETSLATKKDRDAVVFALGDMLRRLGRNDEAFILTFSDNLVFQQDLTGNPEALEKALKSVKPEAGAALLEAVGFASGHLQRIARNRNRALLVISGGRNSNSSATSAFEAQGQIDASNVRIYCIGMGVTDGAARARLEALSARTGGRTAFIDGARQFRVAAHEVALTLGLEFPL